ncbi:MAG: hypothetical protein N4A72_12965 [Bacteroidales bacterium]|jgi:hypothetical protein|nr:hypothetical protein [Bacteroidales bacterium]
MSIDDLINISFEQDEIDEIKRSLTSIKDILKSKVINLSPEERKSYGRINTKTENWIDRVFGYMEQRPEITPFYIDKEKFSADIEARKTIMPIINELNSITEGLDDTNKLLSTDVYNTALAYYRNIKLVSKQNVSGTTSIYEDLSRQFPGRRSSTPEE